eukprot:3106055-Alexandrium_andersonii.AAC.1
MCIRDSSCVARYREPPGNSRAREFAAPFIPESYEESPAWAPYAKGPAVECPRCCHTFPPS